MANEKRLVYADKLKRKIIAFATGCNPTNLFLVSNIIMLLDNSDTVDAVELPKGRPGDYLEWSNGFSKKIYYIHAIIICHDGMRYDLGDFAPFVHSCNIVRIMDRKEAEREMKNGKTD